VLLVDASVWVAAGMPANPAHEAAVALIRSKQPLASLDLTFYEVMNAVALKYRQPDDAARLCRLVLRRSEDRLVCVDAELLDAALEDVVSHGLSAYDAAYVAAARRHGWQLVSIDVRDLVSKGLAVTPDAAVYP
jgi:predicted nucleic acid-binding protein